MKIHFLGGAGEIGMNMFLYESDSSAVIVDCGVRFGDSATPGVDYIISDFSYLQNLKNKLAGIVITHGHEDHLGGVPYLMKNLNMDIYAGELAVGILKNKMAEHMLKCSYHKIHDGDEIKLGDMSISFMEINHSIPDTFCLKIRNTCDTFFHMSDFKIDKTPAGGKPYKIGNFKRFVGKDKITAAMIDSTSATNQGKCPSELSVKEGILNTIKDATGRVFFTTFSSNIYRIVQLIEICKSLNRKVLVQGRSIEKNLKIARDLNIVNFDRDIFINLKDAGKYPDNETCCLITGCQGEINSALNRVVSKERVSLQIKEGDTFIFSSRVIPGNEREYINILNNIVYNGGRFVDGESAHIHVSGHAYKKDIQTVLKQIAPKYFIPIHGEPIHVTANIQNAIESGVLERKNCIFAENGVVLTFEDNTLTDKAFTKHARKYIDTRGNFEIDEDMVKIRKNISRDGAVFGIVKLDIENLAANLVKLTSVGFDISYNFGAFLKNNIEKTISAFYESVAYDRYEFKVLLEKYIRKLFKKNLDRRPEVVVEFVLSKGEKEDV